MAQIGQRVGAVMCEEDGKIYFYGYGTYIGEEVPSEDVVFMGARYRDLYPDEENPKIVLDNGKVVYGCECWWDSEKVVRESLKGKEIIIVDPSVERRKALEDLAED